MNTEKDRKEWKRTKKNRKDTEKDRKDTEKNACTNLYRRADYTGLFPSKSVGVVYIAGSRRSFITSTLRLPSETTTSNRHIMLSNNYFFTVTIY